MRFSVYARLPCSISQRRMRDLHANYVGITVHKVIIIEKERDSLALSTELGRDLFPLLYARASLYTRVSDDDTYM